MDKDERRRAMALKPTVLVGKNGITEGITKEALSQIKKNGMVKIRFSTPKDEMEMFEKSMEGQAMLVMKVGKTLVFKKNTR